MPAAHLANRDYLVGDRFTVADAHLTWSLLLLGRAGVDLAQWPSLVAYRDRMQARPQVKAAIGIEMQLLKAENARPGEIGRHGGGDFRGDYSGFAEPRGRPFNDDASRGTSRGLGGNAVPILPE